MERREFLQKAGTATLAVAALSIKGYVIPGAAMLRKASAASGINLPSLKSALDPKEALLLVPSDADFAKYQNAFNLRTILKPQARVLVHSAAGVAQAVQWLAANKVPFAIRCGGHSFEGFSQSSSVVIDVRLMNKVSLDDTGTIVSVGAGAALGAVYAEIGKRNLAVPAGSCPYVGVSGHSLGGGFGPLSRSFGLACDSFESVDLVNAKGEQIHCSETENTDLFWALRGGGGGSFGVATNYRFRTHPVKSLAQHTMHWYLPAKRTAAIFKAWQQWVQQAPSHMNSLLRFIAKSDGTFDMRCMGQSTASESEMRAELAKFMVEKPAKYDVSSVDFLGSVGRFGGKEAPYEQIYMKGKSDYIYDTMSDEGMLAFFEGMQKHPGITPMFDSYGGAIKNVATDATAFFHRKATSCVQYYTMFSQSGMEARMASMKAFHDGLRPYFGQHAYVNYPDLDVKDYGTAYWGDNFARLKKIKAAVDPENIFRHAQSIPLA